MVLVNRIVIEERKREREILNIYFYFYALFKSCSRTCFLENGIQDIIITLYIAFYCYTIIYNQKGYIFVSNLTK